MPCVSLELVEGVLRARLAEVGVDAAGLGLAELSRGLGVTPAPFPRSSVFRVSAEGGVADALDGERAFARLDAVGLLGVPVS